jgi:hypothetical protein
MAFTNLDEVATWMLSNIRMSRYDDQFVNNITLYIIQHGRITSNQHSLFKRVASKYVRQFNHFKINVNDIVNLSWSVDIVESALMYTSASIMIEDNTIYFKSPYNKNFISAHKKKPIHSMIWHSDTRQYTLNYNLTSLRDLIYLASDYYPNITYCEVTKAIIEEVSEYEAIKYWEPVLTYHNGFYCIKAINTYLYEAIKDMPFNDDLRTVATLVKHGVKIDDSVIDHFNKSIDPDKVKFASTFHVEFELKDLSIAMEWLVEMGCDGINQLRLTKHHLHLLGNTITTMPVTDLNNCNNPVIIYNKSGMPSFNDRPKNLMKLIKCVNSEPIYLGPK